MASKANRALDITSGVVNASFALALMGICGYMLWMVGMDFTDYAVTVPILAGFGWSIFILVQAATLLVPSIEGGAGGMTVPSASVLNSIGAAGSSDCLTAFTSQSNSVPAVP